MNCPHFQLFSMQYFDGVLGIDTDINYLVLHDFMLWCRIRGGLGLDLGWTLGITLACTINTTAHTSPAHPAINRHNCGHSHRVIKWEKWWRRNRIRPPTHPATYSMLSSILHPVWWRMAKSIESEIFCRFSTLLQATDTDSLLFICVSKIA